MATPFACCFNRFYILQAFILLFIQHCAHPPSFFPSLSMVPHPVFLISGLSLLFGDVGVFFLQSKVFLQLNTFTIHPVTDGVMLSSDNYCIDIAESSSDHCCTKTVLPSSDHYCIETVAPSGDHYCIETVQPSSDHHGSSAI